MTLIIPGPTPGPTGSPGAGGVSIAENGGSITFDAMGNIDITPAAGEDIRFNTSGLGNLRVTGQTNLLLEGGDLLATGFADDAPGRLALTNDNFTVPAGGSPIGLIDIVSFELGGLGPGPAFQIEVNALDDQRNHEAIIRLDSGAGAVNVMTFIGTKVAVPGTLDIAGNLFTIGAPATTGDVTVGGIVINQTGPGSSLAVKMPSGVSHTMTGIAEADTYGLFQAAQGGSGGFVITGLKDNTNSAGFALWLRGFIVGSTEVSKLTSSIGNIVLDAAKGSGVGVGVLSSNANMVVMRSNQTAKFIFSERAEMHALGPSGTSVYGSDCVVAGLHGFYGQGATAKPTGVAMSVAGIHAALVMLNLIS